MAQEQRQYLPRHHVHSGWPDRLPHRFSLLCLAPRSFILWLHSTSTYGRSVIFLPILAGCITEARIELKVDTVLPGMFHVVVGNDNHILHRTSCRLRKSFARRSVRVYNKCSICLSLIRFMMSPRVLFQGLGLSAGSYRSVRNRASLRAERQVVQSSLRQNNTTYRVYTIDGYTEVLPFG